MKISPSHLFSERAKGMKASEIRELLKLTEMPDIISFAGGLPSPAAFPTETVKKIVSELMVEKGGYVLQYGTTEGVTALRKALLARLKETQGFEASMENIIITAGSQQSLDLVGKIFLDPGDNVIVGAPTYLAATNAFRLFRANVESVPIGNNGMDMDYLEEKIRQMERHSKSIKFIYVIPTFQNPMGVSMSVEGRKRLLEIAREHDLLILEDDPYSELRYEGTPLPSIKSMDEDGRVVYMGTISKVLAPGLRIAWVVGEVDIINKMILAKQPTDLCTNTLGQHIAAKYISEGYIDPHIERIRDMYRRKRDRMLKALEDKMPEGITWTHPEGGMFIWVTLPDGMNARSILEKAITEKVAYVVGDAFFPDGTGKNTLRLNFTNADDDKIDEGIGRLAAVFRREMNN